MCAGAADLLELLLKPSELQRIKLIKTLDLSEEAINISGAFWVQWPATILTSGTINLTVMLQVMTSSTNLLTRYMNALLVSLCLPLNCGR